MCAVVRWVDMDSCRQCAVGLHKAVARAATRCCCMMVIRRPKRRWKEAMFDLVRG